MKKNHIAAVCVGVAVLLSLFYIALVDEVPQTDSSLISEETRRTSSSYLDSGFTLTLVAGNTQAYLNGLPVCLDSPPIISHKLFYFPICSVVDMLGGVCQEDDGEAEIELGEHTIRLHVGAPEITVDGIPYKNTKAIIGFTLDRQGMIVDEFCSPQIFDGTLYFPCNVLPADCPSFGLNICSMYPEANMVILGKIENETGIEGIHLNDSFIQAESRLCEFEYIGIVDEVLNYSICEYSKKGIEVYIMKKMEGTEDVEEMDNKVCAIRITGREYQTQRGLKIGDSPLQAALLYGTDNLNYSFSYTVKYGCIETISFSTRYYSM